jgi:hypothetical protein
MDKFILAETQNNIQREAYNIFDVCGDVGGISQVMISIAAFLLLPISELSFKLETIFMMFQIS